MNGAESAEALRAHSERLLQALRAGQIEAVAAGIAERAARIAALGETLRQGATLPGETVEALQRQDAELQEAAAAAQAAVGRELAALRRGRVLEKSYGADTARGALFIDRAG